MNPRYSPFSPTCCPTHQHLCVKVKHADTSEWRFEEDPPFLKERKFDPYEHSPPSTQHKLSGMKLLIDAELGNKLRGELVEEFKEIQLEANSTQQETGPKSEKSDKPIQAGTAQKEAKGVGILAKFKESKEATSPYLILLNRLDEEEGVRTPSIEDKLKLAEDRLRITTAEFCSTCDRLLDPTHQENPHESKHKRPFLSPQAVQEAFRSKVFDPSSRPPRTMDVSDVEKKPLAGVSKNKSEEMMSRKKERKARVKLKQGFYLPSHTWFVHEKQRDKMSQEEVELLNSTSTKAFFKFLKDRQKEPPKVLQEIEKKLQNMQDNESSPEK